MHDKQLTFLQEIKEVTEADVLEYARKKHISRFFDTLANESIHINNSENKNNMLIHQANSSRIAHEMAERKRRQMEITGRIELDEILKQVIITAQKSCTYVYIKNGLRNMSYILTDSFRRNIFSNNFSVIILEYFKSDKKVVNCFNYY